ncbi:MAG: hypothetical protein KBB83_01690 [Alphaproteobacteria bacterium]|nr:hypothetical protein [Alphaproteobacteria bacterium]
MRNFIIGLSLTGLILSSAPTKAADDFSEWQVMQSSRVDMVENIAEKPTLRQIAQDLYEGGTDLAKGTVSLAKVAGGLGRDVLYTADAVGNFVSGVSKVTLSPFVLAFKDKEQAQAMVYSGKDNFVSAFSSFSEIAKSLPEDAKNAKDVFVNGFEGGKKFATAVKKAYESDFVQTKISAATPYLEAAKAAVVDLYSSVKSTLGGWASSFSSFASTFENLSF